MFALWWDHIKLRMLNVLLIIIILAGAWFFLSGKISISPPEKDPSNVNNPGKIAKTNKEDKKNDSRKVDR